VSQSTADDAKKDSANAATFDSKEEGAFLVITLGDLDLLSNSSDGDDKERWKYVSSEEDYFSEMGNTDEGGESSPPGDVTSDDDPAEFPSDSVSLVHDGQISMPVVELYDSGSTHHISPYKDC